MAVCTEGPGVLGPDDVRSLPEWRALMPGDLQKAARLLVSDAVIGLDLLGKEGADRDPGDPEMARSCASHLRVAELLRALSASPG